MTSTVLPADHPHRPTRLEAKRDDANAAPYALPDPYRCFDPFTCAGLPMPHLHGTRPDGVRV